MQHETGAATQTTERLSPVRRGLQAGAAFLRRDKRRAFLLAGGTAALAAALVFLLVANAKIKIDVAQVAQVSYTGINEHGKAIVVPDWSSFTQAVQEKYAEKPTEMEQTLLLVQENVSFVVEKAEELRNGDEITLTASWPKELPKLAKVKFKNSTQTLIVSGLPDGTEADVFEGVTLSYEGIAPYASAKASPAPDREYPFEIQYAVTPESGLANGDTVTVTAQYDPAAALGQLYFVERGAKTFSVEGLSTYAAALSDFSEADMTAFQQQAQALIKTKLTASILSYFYATGRPYAAGLDLATATVERIACEKAYLLVRKPEYATATVPKNKLYLLYRVQGTDNTAPDGFSSYLLVCSKGDGIFVQPDGTSSGFQIDTTLYDAARGTDAQAIYESMLAPQTNFYDIDEMALQA